METELLADLLFGPARILHGSRLDDDELIFAATEAFGDRAFYIVRNWMLIDVMLTDRHETLIRGNGLQPTVMYANTVVSAGYGAGEAPSGVLSGFQRRYEDYSFETEGMLYVLAGRGSRKFAGVPAVFALSQQCGGEFRVDDGR